MNSIEKYLQLTKIELIHFFGKSEEEADKMIQNSKYFQSPATIPIYAHPSTWGGLIMGEKRPMNRNSSFLHIGFCIL